MDFSQIFQKLLTIHSLQGYVLYILFLFLFLYGYFLYPACLVLIEQVVKHKGKVSHIDRSWEGVVSIIIAVKNGEGSVRPRLDNLLSQQGLAAREHEIILVSDGSIDRTVEEANSLGLENVRVIKVPVNRGKPFCLNLAVSIARGDILIFADVRQEFSADAMDSLLLNFSDPGVGAVSGQLFPSESKDGVGKGMDLYWKIEKKIRTSESAFGSCIGCTGAIYAMRRNLYSPIPSDTLLDDVVIPVKTLERGKRVLYELDAHAFDGQVLSIEKERTRKARTIAGNFQMLFRYPHWLVCLGPKLSWMYFSHKISRLLAPFCLPVLLVLPLFYRDEPFIVALGLFQMASVFYALLGFVLPTSKLPLLSKLSAFLFMNLMVYRGLYNYLRGTYKSGW
jgi:glycosyltransferase involved in cell wall biosynthesis